MIYREALLSDIPQMMVVRHSVKENVLSDPALVPEKDYREYLLNRGKGWVCIQNKLVVGFSIVDLKGNNIWALFVMPEAEGRGIGRKLHDLMLDWYFGKTRVTVWLSTAPGSRAEKFYRKSAWKETGLYGKGEIKFEMDFNTWQKR